MKYAQNTAYTAKRSSYFVGRLLASVAILFLFSWIKIWAAPIDQSQAIQIAQDFFAQHDNLRSSNEANQTLSLVYAPQAISTSTKSIKPGAPFQKAFWVFNRGQQNGFVIVAGDDELPLILGYSLQGLFVSEEEMPAHIASFMEAIQRTVSYWIEHPNSLNIPTRLLNVDTRALPQSVRPLLGNIQWNQIAPWDKYTPTVNGKKTPVGCVATATAQVMRKWQWPLRGVGNYSYTESNGRTHSVDFSKEDYDWANMPENIQGHYTPEQEHALSLLSYHIGAASDMEYALEGSGAHLAYVVPALREHFSYDKNVTVVYRSSYTQAGWENLLKNELATDRPVVYAGFGSPSGSGHAFVCDGYDAQGLFHINWGWGGVSDGYFLLNALEPSILGTGGGTGGGFSDMQQMIIGIQPDRDGTSQPAPTAFASWGFRASLYGTEVKAMEAVPVLISEKVASTSFRLEAEDINNPGIKFAGDPTSTVYKFFLEAKNVAANLPTLSTNNLPETKATYKVYLAHSYNGTFFPWKSKHNIPSYVLLHCDGAGNWTLERAKNTPKLSLVDGSVSAKLFGYEKSTITFSIKNSGEEEFFNLLTIPAFNITQRVNIPAGATETITMEIDRLPYAPGTTFPNLKLESAKYFDAEKNRETTFSANLGNVTTQTATQVRAGLVASYIGNTLPENGYIPLPIDNPILKGITLTNVGTQEAYTNFQYYVILYYYDSYGRLVSAYSQPHYCGSLAPGEQIPVPEWSLSSQDISDLELSSSINSRLFIYIAVVKDNQYKELISQQMPPVFWSKITGIEKPKALSLALYPNPANSQVTVSGVTPGEEVQIFQTNGLLLYSGFANAAGTLQIDLSQYPAGNYIVKTEIEARTLVIAR